MLNYTDLYTGFINIMNNTKDYSEDLVFVSQKWMGVFKNFYTNQILPISGISNPNLFNSLQIFQSNLLNAIKTQTVKNQFEILVKNLHTNICMGVNMTGIYTTIVPISPLKLTHCFDSNSSNEIIANKLAMSIFTWVMTTTSIQNSSGAVIKWM